MIRRIVLDASVAVAWVHPAQATREFSMLLSQVGSGMQLVVPALWPLEVANALLSLERRKKLRAEERIAGLAALRGLPVTVDQEMSALAFTLISEIACDQVLSIYDATYLELALRTRLPLACNDGALRAAAIRRGVTIAA